MITLATTQPLTCMFSAIVQFYLAKLNYIVLKCKTRLPLGKTLKHADLLVNCLVQCQLVADAKFDRKTKSQFAAIISRLTNKRETIVTWRTV